MPGIHEAKGSIKKEKIDTGEIKETNKKNIYLVWQLVKQLGSLFGSPSTYWDG